MLRGKLKKKVRGRLGEYKVVIEFWRNYIDIRLYRKLFLNKHEELIKKFISLKDFDEKYGNDFIKLVINLVDEYEENPREKLTHSIREFKLWDGVVWRDY